MTHDTVPAATNMLAISFSRRDKKQASAILSDAIAIAGVLGCALAAAMFFYAPPALRAINGAASAELVQPAVTYVRWRCKACPAHCQHPKGACLSVPVPCYITHSLQENSASRRPLNFLLPSLRKCRQHSVCTV